MNRRRFVVLISGALAAPIVLGQQSGRIFRVGFLSALSSRETVPFRDAFLLAMSNLGYVAGKDLLLTERYADGKVEGLHGLAADLVQLKVDLIFTATAQAVGAVQRATTSIPIVFVAVSDPVKLGFAESVARPGRNLTGLSNFAGDLAPKRLELLKETLPTLSRVALLVNPGNPNSPGLIKRVQTAAESIGLQVVTVDSQSPEDIEFAFSSMRRERAGAVLVSGDTYHFEQRARIAEAAMKRRIASIFPFRECAEAGGLMSYGTDVAHQFRQAATYVDKILKGAKPGELPIEQPTRFDFVVNLKTAKAMGLAIPPTVLLRADRVIE